MKKASRANSKVRKPAATTARPKPPCTPQFVNIAPFADYIGVKPSTVYSAVHRGKLKALVIGGRILLARQEVERMLRAAGVTEPVDFG